MQNRDDDLKDPNNYNINKLADDNSQDDTTSQNPIPTIPVVDEGLPNEAQFEEPVASPAVTGEENVFSGDAPEGEPADIDEELKKVGLTSNNNDEA